MANSEMNNGIGDMTSGDVLSQLALSQKTSNSVLAALNKNLQLTNERLKKIELTLQGGTLPQKKDQRETEEPDMTTPAEDCTSTISNGCDACDDSDLAGILGQENGHVTQTILQNEISRITEAFTHLHTNIFKSLNNDAAAEKKKKKMSTFCFAVDDCKTRCSTNGWFYSDQWDVGSANIDVRVGVKVFMHTYTNLKFRIMLQTKKRSHGDGETDGTSGSHGSDQSSVEGGKTNLQVAITALSNIREAEEEFGVRVQRTVSEDREGWWCLWRYDQAQFMSVDKTDIMTLKFEFDVEDVTGTA